MLYTFSESVYDSIELERYFQLLTDRDAVVLWQNGVVLLLKYPHLFTKNSASCYVMEDDIRARGLKNMIPSFVNLISMSEFVTLTEQFSPQIAL
ncbi:sulfurtransferase complex subunit TusB [Bisgaard Taxon 10/6]|uniref:sulfurtransferase complex subunit TusB n=1 Tax=Exercitatus varius TaxID=67857 RepID=UPI00294B88D6|nr:sulfurtransferase complex subunit TusB [Exercitatus varius]MDG2960920.1 sulfurtransferase complex subunit TusB [Exercitatus varius]